MPGKASLLQLSRKTHLYFGLFLSPSILFFAFTGAVQTLGYHESSSNYKPPALLESLGQIHKKQTYLIPVRRGPAKSGEVARPVSAGPPLGTASQPDRRPEAQSAGGMSPALPSAKAPSTPETASTQPPGTAPPSAPHIQAPGEGGPRPGGPPQTLQAKQKQHLPLKIFFVLVSLGLFTSTFTGIYMAYKYDRNKVLVTLLLLAGIILPIVLVSF